MEFLENDLIPFALGRCLDEFNQDNSHSLIALTKCFVDFLSETARCLEGLSPETYPQNALYVVTTLDRALEKMKTFQITPDSQASF